MFRSLGKNQIDPPKAFARTRARKILVQGLSFEDMCFGRPTCITQITRKPIIRDGKMYVRWLRELREVAAFVEVFDMEDHEYTHYTYRLA